MTRDPILREVREVRERHAALVGYDLKAIFADLARTERRRSGKLIDPPPQGEPPPDVGSSGRASLAAEPCRSSGTRLAMARTACEEAVRALRGEEPWHRVA